MTKKIVVMAMLVLTSVALVSCSSNPKFFSGLSNGPVAPSQVNMQAFPNDPSFWQGSVATIWDKLQHIPLTRLQEAATQSNDPNITAWIKLAIIGKQYSTDTNQLVTQLMTWRAAYRSHPGNGLFPDNGTLSSLTTASAPKHFTLLLPLQGPLASQGQAVRDGFLSAYYNSLATTKTQQTVSFLDTTQNPNISALYQKALADGSDAIIGPLTKDKVQTLAHQGTFPVPTLALNYTDMWFGSLPANFYEFGLSPLDEAQQAADEAWREGHKHALVIAPNDEWGQRVVKNLVSRWQSLGGSVSDTLYFKSQDNLAQDIAGLLHVNPSTDDKKMHADNNKTDLEQQRRQDFDIIFLLAPPQSARQIVPLLKYYYADNIPIFSTSVIYSGSPSADDSDLNGVKFFDIPSNLGMGNAHGNRLYAVGHDAYTLSNQIARLTKLPNFPIYGSTGAMSLTAQQQIFRRLPWAQMHDGHP